MTLVVALIKAFTATFMTMIELHTFDGDCGCKQKVANQSMKRVCGRQVLDQATKVLFLTRNNKKCCEDEVDSIIYCVTA